MKKTPLRFWQIVQKAERDFVNYGKNISEPRFYEKIFQNVVDIAG